MKCTRHHECVLAPHQHDEMCRKIDGTVILRRREPALEAQIEHARRLAALKDVELAAVRRAPDAEAQIAEARAMPTDGPPNLQRNASWTSGPAFIPRTPPPVLLTNHPEVTDPAERARLGLEPLDVMEEAACRVHGAGADAQNGVFDLQPDTGPPRTLLDGEDHAAFDAFGTACAALEDHAQQTQALQTNYRAALERISQMAARRKRGTP